MLGFFSTFDMSVDGLQVLLAKFDYVCVRNFNRL